MGGAGADRTICAICSAPQLTALGYIRALPALIRRYEEEQIFRVYLTDFLAGRYDLNVRYLDLIPDPNRKPPPDPKEGRKRIRDKLSQ